MAKFGENIVEFKDVSKLDPLPVTCNGNQWFIIIGKSSVIKVQDSKTLHTWTLVQRHLHYFSSPVAYFDEKLYSIIDKNVLIRWSLEDDNLENAEKVELKEPVRTVLALDEQPPLIIFESGRFAIVEGGAFSDLTPQDSFSLKNDEKLHWVDATSSATEIVLFYVVYNEKVKSYTFCGITVNKKNISDFAVHTYEMQHGSASFKSCCANQDLSFFSLWSDGMIRCYNMKNSKDIPLLSVQDIDKDSIVDINSADSTHIVIAKGKPKNSECILEIWDIKNAIHKGRREFKTSPLNSIQVAAIDDHIFLNYSKMIAIPFSVNSTLLSAMNATEEVEIKQNMWTMGLELEDISHSDEVEDMDVRSSSQSFQNSPELLLVEKLLKEDSSDLVTIPESDLVKMLQFIISYKKHEENVKWCSEENIHLLLNLIFSASYIDALLMKHLRKLNVGDILVVLNFLLGYLKHTANIPPDSYKRPSDLQIVNWICLIISSHTEALLFTKEISVKNLLKDLKKTLSQKMEEYEDLEDIQSYFSILLEKKDILPQHYSVEKYSLEALDI